MKRSNGIEWDAKGAFVYWDDAQAEIDRLKEIIKEEAMRGNKTFLSQVEEITRLKGVANEVDEEARKARLVLLLNHGHKGPYLDDGEMQCCECGFVDHDFKKPSLSELTKRVVFKLNAEIDRLKEIIKEEAMRGNKTFLAQVEEITRLKEENQRYREALLAARNELGVPQPGYPQPVANAYEIIQEALTAQPEKEG